MRTLLSDIELQKQPSTLETAASSYCVLDDSPYAASPSDVCELSVSSAVGIQSLRRCVDRLRGIHVTIPHSKGYIYFVGNEEDTILTECDIQFWKMHPLMCGEVCLIGTLGHRRTLAWDRHIVAINAVGHVYVYTMHDETFITKIADSLTDLLTIGICQNYMKMQKDLREGKTPSITAVCLSPTGYSSWIPAECSKWLPIEIGGVRCARVPSEKIRRGLHLQCDDFPDDMFKTACSHHCS